MSSRFILYRNEREWPSVLEVLPESYTVLRGCGKQELLGKPALGIIGARRCTPYGIAIAQMAGRIAAQSGVVVVSGGAMGCDYAATRAALDASGEVIIVSGCGADAIYPKTSSDIFNEVKAGKGVVISCEAWGQAPRRYAFPKRNKLIAALCRCLLVTEAGMPSGTFSTAQAANDFGKTVYAAPGSIFSPQSRGTNNLIESGACIITDEVALETRLSLDFGKSRLVAQNTPQQVSKMLSALIASPIRPDELALRLDQNILTIIRTLTEYEAKRLVQRLPDGRWCATAQTYMPPQFLEADLEKHDDT